MQYSRYSQSIQRNIHNVFDEIRIVKSVAYGFLPTIQFTFELEENGTLPRLGVKVIRLETSVRLRFSALVMPRICDLFCMEISLVVVVVEISVPHEVAASFVKACHES